MVSRTVIAAITKLFTITRRPGAGSMKGKTTKWLFFPRSTVLIRDHAWWGEGGGINFFSVP